MKSTAQQTKLLRRSVREIRSWCKDPRTGDDLQRFREGLQKQLRSNHPRAAVVAVGQLRAIANWHSYHGSRRVLDGDAQGWADLDIVLHYEWWDARIEASNTLLAWAATTLAHALVFGEERMAGWLAARMIRGLEDKTFGSWENHPFAVFTLELWHRFSGAPRPDLDRPGIARLGVYRAILDTWQDGTGLVTALMNACDYHLDQTVYSDEVYKEFDRVPYELFPVDILAIAAVRAKQGLPMPELDHPLMQTPLAKPPPNDIRPRMPPDPLLDAVIEKARKQGFLPADGDVFAP